MAQTIQDIIRERDNAKRGKVGATADVSAAVQAGMSHDLGAIARANAMRKKPVMVTKPIVAKPSPKPSVRPNAQRDSY